MVRHNSKWASGPIRPLLKHLPILLLVSLSEPPLLIRQRQWWWQQALIGVEPLLLWNASAVDAAKLGLVFRVERHAVEKSLDLAWREGDSVNNLTVGREGAENAICAQGHDAVESEVMFGVLEKLAQLELVIGGVEWVETLVESAGSLDGLLRSLAGSASLLDRLLSSLGFGLHDCAT